MKPIRLADAGMQDSMLILVVDCQNSMDSAAASGDGQSPHRSSNFKMENATQCAQFYSSGLNANTTLIAPMHRCVIFHRSTLKGDNSPRKLLK
jgi:hypothetical protein